eukprot:13642579-Alexandrium_andersonii.AAC.1
MFRLFRNQRSPPIASGSDGVPVAQPRDVDRVVNQEWQPVFAGNGCPEVVAAEYIATFGNDVPSLPEFQLGPICPGKLWRAFRKRRRAAGGCDGR